MQNQEETVQIHIKSIGKTVNFPVRSSEFCKRCKGSGKKDKRPCPYCCGSGSVKMLDCIRCNGTKLIDNGLKCNVCDGNGTLTEVKTREFLSARQFCENFKKNPAKTILICIACLVALAVCAHIVSGYAFIDFRLIKSWPAYISLLVGLCAGFYVLVCLNKMNKGSYLPQSTKTLISVAVIAIWIAAIVIPGPVTGRYCWIESQAKGIISEGVSSQGISCNKVKVVSSDSDDYHAIANLSNGERMEVDIHYKKIHTHNRKITYSIDVVPVDKNNNSSDGE